MSSPMQDPMALMRMMQSDDGVENLMQEPIFPTENGGKVSQAEVLADTINIYRMDAKKFGEIHGVQVSINRITPDKVAWMLAEMIDGNPGPIIDTFNGIEDLHLTVFDEVLSDEEYEQYDAMKKSVLYTQNDDLRADYRDEDDDE